MSIEFGIWNLDEIGNAKELHPSALDYEDRLETILAKDISTVAPQLMVIGRQVRTAFDKYIDLLAIDSAGNLVVLELKRDRTYRDIVAQVLDYGSWVSGLEDDEIARIYEEYRRSLEDPSDSLDSAFLCNFHHALPDELNTSHQLLIIASEFDPSTERIVDYLANDYNLDINAIFFKFFKDEDSEYLARAWLRGPSEEPERNTGRDWNGEYYVSFGHHEYRDWEEARRWGFISAGGGYWFTNSLLMLEEGARVWVNVPGRGYVGVGVVSGPRQAATDIKLQGTVPGKLEPALELCTSVRSAVERVEDQEEMEYLVPVTWLKTVALEQAVKEKGFFGNQNTVARPRVEKWRHTVARLKKRFEISA